ncbi:hypothetical protein [Priestia aryabhattai]|uniref:hypothetical protein n=1 Tax=Priestia aryabhattai TaxID=412384 RepID=UPI003B67DEF5
MTVKETKIKIVTKIIVRYLVDGTYTDVYEDKPKTFTVRHDEGTLINYDYLHLMVEEIEEYLLNSLICADDMVYNIHLKPEYWEIGNDIYSVEDHEQKQLKKLVNK